jgi:hypothetical protein
MNRFVAAELVATSQRHGAARMVVRDPRGREASFVRPTTAQSVDSMVALMRSQRLRLVRVVVRSGLSMAAGGRLYFRRWFLFTRHVDVNAGLAVALAERLGVRLLIDDRVFQLEKFEERDDLAAQFDEAVTDDRFIQ